MEYNTTLGIPSIQIEATDMKKDLATIRRENETVEAVRKEKPDVYALATYMVDHDPNIREAEFRDARTSILAILARKRGCVPIAK